MIEITAIALLTVPLGFVMGSALNHGGTCAVAAARDLVGRRDAGPAIALVLSAGIAGLLCLALAWAAGMSAHVAGGYRVGPALLLGAVLLGVGAVVNGACLLGSLARLGDGESRLLALPVGLAIGFWAAAWLKLAPSVPPAPNPLVRPGAGGATVVLVAGLLAAGAWLMIRDRSRRTPGTSPLAKSAALLGACGGLLFLVQPNWSYADLVHQRFGAVMLMAGGSGLASAVATIAGVSLAGWRRRRFRPRRPDASGIARSLGGGALMALGAALVPGGNDALLLAAVPAATPSGLTAYGVMSATVLALTWTASVAELRRDAKANEV